MTHHPLGIIGLTLNMIGAALLLWCPPGAGGYQKDGSMFAWWHLPATPHGKRRYWLLTFGFRFGIALLVIGFLFQMLDLIYG
jgi:nitrate reductase gamma subunit